MSRTAQLAIPLTSLSGEVLGIGAVERETGLSKDTLRVWERRYGFPNPTRSAHGERVYPTDQIEKLRLLRRLTERGLRPGKIIALDVHVLENLGLEQGTGTQARADLELLLELLREHDVSELRRQLTQTLMRQGLHAFVLDTIAPLNERVVEEWMRGELELYEEHLYTEQAQGVLRSAIHSAQHEGSAPCVLVAGLANESRALGRLMLEAMLCVGGAVCIPLGAEIPRREIARAAAAYNAHVVMLCISAMSHDTASGMAELRTLLPRNVEIWASGTALTRLKKPPQGVHLMFEEADVLVRLQTWRMSHGQ